MDLKRLTYLLFIGGLVALLSVAGCDELITEQNDIVVFDSTLGQACLECHNDEDNRFLRPKGQWANSAHAVDTLLDRTVNLNGVDQSINQCGPECHTHEGFLRVFDSLTLSATNYSVIGCFTCHQPHTGEYGSWTDTTLRALGEYTFLANDSIFEMDNSNMCAHCHQAASAGPSAAETGEILITEEFGPHYSGQADLFAGTGGFRFDVTPVPNSHGQLFDNGACIACHFGAGQGYQFGEHTFRLEKIDGADTTNYFGNCVACHEEPVDNFYQIVEGGSSPLANIASFIDSLEVLLKTRAYLDPADPTGGRFLIDSLIPADAARILYNYLLVRNEGSDGIHNPAYAEILLLESIQQFDLLPPKVSFGADILAGCAPLDVVFADSTLGENLTNWLWDFGDGDSSTVQNPSHTFVVPGNYAVTLTVTSPNGTDSETRSGYIRALAAIPEFVADSVEGCGSLTVSFSSVLTQGDIISYLWDFGDGNTSIEQHPVHTYLPTVSSRFDVTLTVTDSCGQQSINKPAYISVALETPTVDFTIAGDSTGQAPFTVEFSDLSTGLIDEYEWDFGDGSPHSNEQNPTHEYTDVGQYTVALTVKNACGQDTRFRGSFIIVTE